MGIIFRNDDVSANTNLEELAKLYNLIHELPGDKEIWNCVNIFSRLSQTGAVYPGLPLKNKPLDYFFDVDQVVGGVSQIGFAKTVSHGLWHFDHSKVDAELQEASIVTSCRILFTDIFVPPFNNWNEYTEDICDRNNIRLVKYEEGWKSFEHNKFDPEHKLWYFHSWKWTPEKLRAYLENL